MTPHEQPERRVGLILHPRTPRSLRVHDSALLATRELLAEGGLGAATIDAISGRSGVSKATLYKHWPSRIAIAAEAFGSDVAQAVPVPDTGTTEGDLREQIRLVSSFYASAEGQVYRELVAACVQDEGGAAYFRAFFLAGRRTTTKVLWERGVERGDVRPGIDAELATDLMFGPLLLRLMTGHLPLTDEGADAIAGAAFGGLLRRTD
ncbi:MAG: TetR/AcrR family transcriptional regulator [Nocardioidaceae bacterium]